jgi:hypothetical protein
MLLHALRATKVLALLTAPLGVAAVFWRDYRLAAGLFLFFSVLTAFLCLKGLHRGVIDTRQGRAARDQSPGAFWLLVAILAAASFTTAIVSLLALLGLVTIHQQAPW